jgi:voltage-gated sodium channel
MLDVPRNRKMSLFGHPIIRIGVLSLFQMITLDDWRTMYDSARTAGPFAATPYFVSFILLGTMIMLNLFIGIVMNSMSEMHAELDALKESAQAKSRPDTSLVADLAALDEQLDAMRSQLDALRVKLSHPSK